MPAWYWYFSRGNELFLDLDKPEFVQHCRRRLQGAIDSGKLDVEKAYFFPSSRHGHVHIIVKLRDPMPSVARFVWEIVLRSDLYRGCCNIMRAIHGCEFAADLLITRRAYMFRDHDAVCYCEGKHTRAIMETCPVAIRYRGELRNHGFFGKPSEKLFTDFTRHE